MTLLCPTDPEPGQPPGLRGAGSLGSPGSQHHPGPGPVPTISASPAGPEGQGWGFVTALCASSGPSAPAGAAATLMWFGLLVLHLACTWGGSQLSPPCPVIPQSPSSHRSSACGGWGGARWPLLGTQAPGSQPPLMAAGQRWLSLAAGKGCQLVGLAPHQALGSVPPGAQPCSGPPSTLPSAPDPELRPAPGRARARRGHPGQAQASSRPHPLLGPCCGEVPSGCAPAVSTCVQEAQVWPCPSFLLRPHLQDCWAISECPPQHPAPRSTQKAARHKSLEISGHPCRFVIRLLNSTRGAGHGRRAAPPRAREQRSRRRR